MSAPFRLVFFPRPDRFSRTCSLSSRALVSGTLYDVCLSPQRQSNISSSHVMFPLHCSRGRSITTVPFLDLAQRHVTKGLNHLTEDVFAKGEGSWVTMHSGRKLLDFTSGIGVTNLGASGVLFSHHHATLTCKNSGHCHPKVSRAAADQCLNLVHGQVPPFLHTFSSLLSER